MNEISGSRTLASKYSEFEVTFPLVGGSTNTKIDHRTVADFIVGKEIKSELNIVTVTDSFCNLQNLAIGSSGAILIEYANKAAEGCTLQNIYNRITSLSSLKIVLFPSQQCPCDLEAGNYSDAFKASCTEAVANKFCEETLPLPTSISAEYPVVVISKWDATRLMDCIATAGGASNPVSETTCSSADVAVSLKWNPPPSETANMHIWRSVLQTGLDPIQGPNFLQWMELLGDTVSFTPELYIVDGTKYGCDASPAECENLCLNNKYCLPGDQVTTGKARVEESQRELCLWDSLSGTQNEKLSKFRSYLVEHSRECEVASTTSKLTAECSATVANALGIKWSEVEACVSSKGEELLEGSLTRGVNIVTTPQLQLNSIELQLSTVSLFSMTTILCKSVEELKINSLCDCALENSSNAENFEKDCVEGSALETYQIVIIVLSVLIAIMLVVLICMYKRVPSRSEMNDAIEREMALIRATLRDGGVDGVRNLYQSKQAQVEMASVGDKMKFWKKKKTAPVGDAEEIENELTYDDEGNVTGAQLTV